MLKNAGVAISMDGRGRCMDNIFIERLWRSLKYEAVYLHELADGFAAQRAIAKWLNFYDTTRPHSALAGTTPAEDLRKRTAAAVAAQARPLVCPSASSTRTQSHDKQDSGGMIGRPEYTLITLPPPCPTNRDHLRGCGEGGGTPRGSGGGCPRNG